MSIIFIFIEKCIVMENIKKVRRLIENEVWIHEDESNYCIHPKYKLNIRIQWEYQMWLHWFLFCIIANTADFRFSLISRRASLRNRIKSYETEKITDVIIPTCINNEDNTYSNMYGLAEDLYIYIYTYICMNVICLRLSSSLSLSDNLEMVPKGTICLNPVICEEI